MSNQLAINGGPKAVTNKLQGWPQFDENAIKAVEAVLRSGKVNYWTGKQAHGVIVNLQKIVIVAAHLARGVALAGEIDRLHSALRARKELLLHVSGDFHFGFAPPFRIRLLADHRDHARIVPRFLDE